MAYEVRAVPDEILFALVKALNDGQDARVSSNFHASVTQTRGGDYRNPTVASHTVAAANATDLATSLVLVNQIKDVMDHHFRDEVAHNTATSAQITIADGTDITTAVALANDLKAKYETHRTASNVHFNNDATNTVTNANATDQTTLNTLINEIKGDINAHVTNATLGSMIRLLPA